MTLSFVLSPELELTAVTESDVDELYYMIQDLAEYDGHKDMATSTPEKLRDNIFLAPQFIEAYFICNPKRIGFVIFYENFWVYQGTRGIYLLALYIVPEHRNKGYGSLVFGFLRQEIKKRGMGQLVWHADIDNLQANKFYQKMNANVIPGYRLNYIKND